MEKVAEQHITTKYSKCNSLRVISHIIILGKSAITHSKLKSRPKFTKPKKLTYTSRNFDLPLADPGGGGGGGGDRDLEMT